MSGKLTRSFPMYLNMTFLASARAAGAVEILSGASSPLRVVKK